MQNIHSELLRYMFILKEKDKVADGNRMELLLLWRRTMNEDVDILPSTERRLGSVPVISYLILLSE